MIVLTQKQLDNFDRDGFLVIDNVIDKHTIDAILKAYKKRVDYIVHRCVQLGDITDDVADNASFQQKITHLICSCPQHYQHLDISLPMMSNLKSQQPAWQRLFGSEWQETAGFLGEVAIFDLVTHPNIITIAKQILKSAVSLSPVQHVRIKPPQSIIPQQYLNDANIARTLWHQDEAVVTEEAKGIHILTVWVAITDASIENGCMNAIAGSHKQSASSQDFGLVKHCPGQPVSEIYIPETNIDRKNLTPLVASKGGIVLLNQRTIHGAGANKSDGLRWSFDLRYQQTGTPSGRECFPCFEVSGDNPIKNATEYRQRWLKARDDILSGKVQAKFNDRWMKYEGVGLCA